MELLVSIIGALFILGAYAALQFGFLNRKDLVFNLLNLIGALILAVIAFRAEQWGFVLLETVWAAVSLPPIFKSKPA